MKKVFLSVMCLIIVQSIFAQKSEYDSIIGTPIKIGNLLVAQYNFPEKMTWEHAQAACAKLGKGWRLPTQDELHELYLNQDSIGFIDNFDFWSSTEGMSTNPKIHIIVSVYSSGHAESEDDEYYGVRAVYSEIADKNINVPNSEPQNANLILGNKVKIGNLEIAENDLLVKMSWDDAKAAIAKLGNGWRLPNKDELNLIYKNKVKFKNYLNNFYWSSSLQGEYVWWQYFKDGTQQYQGKNLDAFVFAIRTIK